MPQYLSVVERSLVGQTLNKPSVETSAVTRRRFISIAPIRDRLLCIGLSREVEIDLAPRLVAVGAAREVELELAARSVSIRALASRTVVIPPEETCCE